MNISWTDVELQSITLPSQNTNPPSTEPSFTSITSLGGSRLVELALNVLFWQVLQITYIALKCNNFFAGKVNCLNWKVKGNFTKSTAESRIANLPLVSTKSNFLHFLSPSSQYSRVQLIAILTSQIISNFTNMYLSSGPCCGETWHLPKIRCHSGAGPGPAK